MGNAGLSVGTMCSNSTTPEGRVNSECRAPVTEKKQA